MRSKVLLTAVIALIGCTGNTLVHQYRHTSVDGWLRTDTLRYDIEHIPHDGQYDLSVGIRTGNDFPYQAIWIAMQVQMEHPHYVLCDTIHFSTATESGELKGIGMNKKQQEQLVATIPLHRGQTGKILLHHLMTKEVLQDISDVGIKVTNAAADFDSHQSSRK